MPVPQLLLNRTFLAILAIAAIAVYANVTAPPTWHSEPEPATQQLAKSPAPSKKTGPSDLQRTAYAEREISARLRDPETAQFGNVRVSRRSGTPVVCGTVNGKNGFGGMTGPQRFVSGAVTAMEEDMAPGEMQKAWDRIC